ncbi:hypothetical protein GCM10017781_46190 [Deinococcus metalli]|nr:hypothetical protein GCM10017781_46190 [Deinococcus metalli]
MSATLSLLTAPAVAQSFEHFGDFTYYPKIDPMTDENRSYIISDGIEDADASLFFGCQDGRLKIYYDPSDYIGITDDSYTVVYRFDKQNMSAPVEWGVSTTGDAVFLPAGRITGFVRAAKAAKTIILRVFDYNGTAITRSFGLRGLTTALNKLPCARGM